MKLYEIVGSLKDIYNRLEETGGEITPEMAIELSGIEIAFKDKVESTALWIKSMNGEAYQVKAEIERLQGRKASIERGIESLKGYVLDQMIRANELKVKTPLVTVWRQTGQPTINITSTDKIPTKYKTARVTIPYDSLPEEMLEYAEIEINKRAIGDEFKKAPVPGAELLPGREFLRIL